MALRGRKKLFVVAFAAILVLVGVFQAAAEPPANEHFQRVWERTDKPIADLAVNRSWLWGPEGTTGLLQEEYSNSPGGFRDVQYFDNRNPWRLPS